MNFEGVIDGIEQASTIQREPWDYMQDGLLYCGKCHTPKQTQVELFGKIRKPLCLCKCAAEKRDKEQADMKQREQIKRVGEMRRLGFPDADMQGMTFAADDGNTPKLSAIAQNYVDNFGEMRKQSKGLLFYGSVGTGKTFLAACIANALIDKGIPCMVTNFARLANAIGGTFDGKQAYLDGLNKYELLVIDDLGAERETEYMGEMVHNIIDSRYRSGKPIIITTNLTAAEMTNATETRRQRIYSRLFEMCIPIEVSGDDRRKAKLRDGFKDASKILGLG